MLAYATYPHPRPSASPRHVGRSWRCLQPFIFWQVLKPVALLNRGQSFFIWQAVTGHSMLVRANGQTPRKSGGMDAIIASRMVGDIGEGMLKMGM